MNIESDKDKNKKSSPNESFMVQLTDPMLYDRIHTLSAEYSISVELLVSVAVKRLLDDVDLMRSLRAGKTGLE